MAEFGQMASAVFVPLTMTVGLLGGYLIFTNMTEVWSLFTEGLPEQLSLNAGATVFSRDPSIATRMKYEDILGYEEVLWPQPFVAAQSCIKLLIGLWCTLGLICPFSFMAKILYYLSVLYTVVWAVVEGAALWSYNKGLLLEFNSHFRAEKGPAFAFFQTVKWPESFWWGLILTSFRDLSMQFLVQNLFYSWYLILKVGGSGWEMRKAKDLPGWEAYEAMQRAKHGWDEDEEEEEEGAGGAGGGDENNNEQAMQLLSQIMQNSGGGKAGGHTGEGGPEGEVGTQEELQEMMLNYMQMAQGEGGMNFTAGMKIPVGDDNMETPMPVDS